MMRKRDLTKFLEANNNTGIVVIDDQAYEVFLSDKGSIEFSGIYWKWENTLVPSSHQDYLIETDELVKDYSSTPPTMSEEIHGMFYKDINEL